MTATPRTTRLGPDQASLRALIRRLAETTTNDALILSVYADLRPEAHGERPAERPELDAVRHRLSAIQAKLEPHTDARESFDADLVRIETYLDGEDHVLRPLAHHEPLDGGGRFPGESLVLHVDVALVAGL